MSTITPSTTLRELAELLHPILFRDNKSFGNRNTLSIILETSVWSEIQQHVTLANTSTRTTAVSGTAHLGNTINPYDAAAWSQILADDLTAIIKVSTR